jgi:hypothetical protein
MEIGLIFGKHFQVLGGGNRTFVVMAKILRSENAWQGRESFHNRRVEVVTPVTERRPCRIVGFVLSWKLKTRFVYVSRRNWQPLPLLIAAIIQVYPLLSPNGLATPPGRFNLRARVLGFMQSWVPFGSTALTSSVGVAS